MPRILDAQDDMFAKKSLDPAAQSPNLPPRPQEPPLTTPAPVVREEVPQTTPDPAAWPAQPALGAPGPQIGSYPANPGTQTIPSPIPLIRDAQAPDEPDAPASDLCLSVGVALALLELAGAVLIAVASLIGFITSMPSDDLYASFDLGQSLANALWGVGFWAGVILCAWGIPLTLLALSVAKGKRKPSVALTILTMVFWNPVAASAYLLRLPPEKIDFCARFFFWATVAGLASWLIATLTAIIDIPFIYPLFNLFFLVCSLATLGAFLSGVMVPRLEGGDKAARANLGQWSVIASVTLWAAPIVVAAVAGVW